MSQLNMVHKDKDKKIKTSYNPHQEYDQMYRMI